MCVREPLENNNITHKVFNNKKSHKEFLNLKICFQDKKKVSGSCEEKQFFFLFIYLFS